MLWGFPAAQARYPAMAASNASASGSIVRFAFVCGSSPISAENLKVK